MRTTFSINRHFEDGDVSMDRFHADAKAVLGNGLLGLQTHGDDLVVETIHDLTEPQAAGLKAAMAAHRVDKHYLPAVKAAKFAAIDSRTRELFTAGFVFAGLRFSLSIGAQLKLLRLDAIRNGLTYPILMSTIDDGASYSIDDAETLHDFAVDGLMAIHAIIEVGTDLKEMVRAATTVQDVARIIDPR